MSTAPDPCIVSIEGNIGIGKSTTVNALKKQLDGATINGKKCVFLLEPVDEWQSITDKSGEDILTKFYRDQKTYAFPFQMMAYVSRQAKLMEAVSQNPNSIIITERCIHTDRAVFAKMLHEDGLIDDVCYNIYNKWFDTYAKNYDYIGHVYLRGSPEVCYNRIKHRAREGEEIPLSYLTSCHDNHDNWLAYARNTIVVPMDEDLSDAADKYRDVYSRIAAHITECSLSQ